MEIVFSSENVDFVTLSEALVEDYLVMINDYERVGRLIGMPEKKFSKEEEIDWVKKKREENAVVFSMIEKKSGAFIGNLEFMNIKDGSGELGIAVTAGMQDRGLGTEATRAAVAYGQRVLRLDRIWLRVFPDNARAVHVYEKCGFRAYDRSEEDLFMELFCAESLN